MIDGVPGCSEDALAEGGFDDDDGEGDLEAEAPGYGAPADGSAIGGERVGEGEKDNETEKSCESSQTFSPYGSVEV